MLRRTFFCLLPADVNSVLTLNGYLHGTNIDKSLPWGKFCKLVGEKRFEVWETRRRTVAFISINGTRYIVQLSKKIKNIVDKLFIHYDVQNSNLIDTTNRTLISYTDGITNLKIATDNTIAKQNISISLYSSAQSLVKTRYTIKINKHSVQYGMELTSVNCTLLESIEVAKNKKTYLLKNKNGKIVHRHGEKNKHLHDAICALSDGNVVRLKHLEELNGAILYINQNKVSLGIQNSIARL